MDKSLKKLEEKALVLLCQEQLPYIPTAYEELVRRFEKKVFHLCRRYLSVESDAEDVTQEVFMKVFHALPSFNHRSSFTTWLFSIAINDCKTLLAKNKRNAERYEYGNDEIQDGFVDDVPSIEDEMNKDDNRNCIQDAIATMKPDERDMLLLRFSSELALDDIARVLGKKISATKMGFYRTLEKFKLLYEKYCL